MNFHLFGEHTNRLVFKKLEGTDFTACLAFFLDPRSNRYWKSEVTDPNELAEQWFAKQQWRYENNKGAINLLISKESKKVVGWAGLIIQSINNQEELEVAYSILPEHWRKGYATEASKKCIECAFQRRWANSVISIIQVDNVESKWVAIKNGMTLDVTTTYHGNQVNVFRIINNHAK
jgi:ribosomal-protein-alanine N-acetyltransferase